MDSLNNDFGNLKMEERECEFDSSIFENGDSKKQDLDECDPHLTSKEKENANKQEGSHESHRHLTSKENENAKKQEDSEEDSDGHKESDDDGSQNWIKEYKKKLKDLLVRINSLKHKLDDLKSESQLLYLAESVWSKIFDIESTAIKFTKKEKQEFGPLIDSALEVLEYQITCRVFYFGPEVSEEALVERSAVQFLFDNYKDFPAEEKGKTLEEKLVRLMKEDSVNELTGLLENWKSKPRWHFLDYRGSAPGGVPGNHYWWP